MNHYERNYRKRTPVDNRCETRKLRFLSFLEIISALTGFPFLPSRYSSLCSFSVRGTAGTRAWPSICFSSAC